MIELEAHQELSAGALAGAAVGPCDADNSGLRQNRHRAVDPCGGRFNWKLT